MRRFGLNVDSLVPRFQRSLPRTYVRLLIFLFVVWLQYKPISWADLYNVKSLVNCVDNETVLEALIERLVTLDAGIKFFTAIS